MIRALTDLVPDPQTFESLEPEEVAGVVLVFLNATCPSSRFAVVSELTHPDARTALGAYPREDTSGADIGGVAAQLGQSPEIALKHDREATREQKDRAVALAELGSRPTDKMVIALRRKESS